MKMFLILYKLVSQSVIFYTTYPKGNLKEPVPLIHMSLDCGRKPEYPVEAQRTWGEHANST